MSFQGQTEKISAWLSDSSHIPVCAVLETNILYILFIYTEGFLRCSTPSSVQCEEGVGEDAKLPSVGHLYCNIISDLFVFFSHLYKLVFMVGSDAVKTLFPKPGIYSCGCYLIWEALYGCDGVVPSASCALQSLMSPWCMASPLSGFP